jgi:hypothetical protein
MRGLLSLMLAIPLAAGCSMTTKDDDDDSDGGWGDAAEPVHSTCGALDDRGIMSRLDNVRTDNQELFALDGHCLEATLSLTTGARWGIRFAPDTAEGETPDFHIQLYFIPPETDAVLEVNAPDRLSNAECSISPFPEDGFCGHVDDNSNDDSTDDVDLRGKAGELDLQITDTDREGVHRYEGEFEWALYAVDSSVTPEVFTSPSLGMWGTLQWAHPDGSW